MAWLQNAEHQKAITDEKAKECGKTVTMLKIACAKFEKARPFVNILGGQYKTNFEKTLGEACALRDQMVKENKTVYYESEMPLEEAPQPDPTNYVKTISM